MSLRIIKPYQISEIRFVDSDTLEGWVRISSTLHELWRIRLRGIEGGEKGTPEGDHAETHLRRILDENRDCPLHFLGLESVRDQYGRRVGDLVLADGKLLTLTLLATGAYWRRDRSPS